MNEGGDVDVWIRNLSLELFYNTNFMGTERHPLPGPGTGHQQYFQVQEPFQVILTTHKSKAGYQAGGTVTTVMWSHAELPGMTRGAKGPYNNNMPSQPGLPLM